MIGIEFVCLFGYLLGFLNPEYLNHFWSVLVNVKSTDSGVNFPSDRTHFLQSVNHTNTQSHNRTITIV